MENITFNLELNTRPNKEGLYEVLLRITQNKIKTRVKTEVYTLDKNFGVFKDVVNTRKEIVRKRVLTHGAWITKGDKDQAKKNNQLKKKLDEYRDSYMEQKQDTKYVNKEMVVAAVNKQYNLKSFLGYYDLVVSRMDNHNNVKGYNTTRGKIVAFLEHEGLSKNIDFRQVTPDFLRSFERFVNKDISIESTYDSLKRIRKVWNVAIDIDKIVSRSSYPFDGPYQMPKINDRDKTKANLTGAEFVEFIKQHYEVGSHIRAVQKCFNLAFLLKGARIEDMLTLQVKNIVGKFLIYKMKKGVTGGKEMSFIITPAIQVILDEFITADSKPNDFIFPLINPEIKNVEPKSKEYTSYIGSATAVCNKYLKKIADDACISENVTTHIVRHTYAGIMEDYADNVEDLKQIQNDMGHRNLETTQGYLKSIRKDRTSLQNKMLEGLNQLM